MNILYIIRGLPGSGKTTLAYRLTPHVCEADQYFTSLNGEYNYDASKIKDAHDYCKIKAARLMEDKISIVAVSNTFTRKWEYLSYLDIAATYGYQVIEVTLKSEFTSIHAVPQESIDAMRARWEY